ncbi:hypothetical protein NCC49_003627 [Naganishia albida]|nr:hypothetical protein NCC49_003627 [Naganishia albida]
MLVPSFIMWYKSHRRAAALETALSVAQQTRREDALRVMRLAETAPEKLTRAQRAAIEGKIAWRESVSSWRSGSKTPSKSVASSLSGCSGMKLEHLSKGSTLSGGPRGGDLEMALLRSGSRVNRESAGPSSSISVPASAQPIAQIRQNTYDSSISKQSGLVLDFGGPNAPTAPADAAQDSTFIELAAKPSITTDQPVLKTQVNLQTDLPTRSPTSQTTPTKLYGFHLPRPQAGQAYAMQEDGTRDLDVPGNGRLPPLPTSTSSGQTLPPLKTLDVAPMEPVQLALRSPRSPTGSLKPAIVKHVSAPLMRRSAHIRRSSSANPVTSALGAKDNNAGIGPSWHRQRMKRLQSASLEDLQNPK